MYGESFSTPELILAATVMIIIPFLIGLGIEIFDEIKKYENRRL